MKSWSLLVALAVAVAAPGTLIAQQTGSIEGRVTNAETGEPISGVQISLEGTRRGQLSAAQGEFFVPDVSPGTHTVEASSMGYGTVTREIRVRANEAVRLEIELATEAVELGGITVIGRRAGYVDSEAVSGLKVSSSLVEVPQSISVITRERIEAQGAETQAEALRYTPGIQSEVFGPDLLYDWTQIRGFQQYGQNLYRDGLQLRSASQATLRLNPYGAESYEVVRGPASALFGQSSVGGFINYRSKRPRADARGEVELQAGSYDRLQGAVDVTGPITEDGTLLYRLTGLARSAEGQVQFSSDDQIFVAPALTWRPTSSTTLTLMGDYQRDEAVRGTSFLPASGTVRPNPHGRIPVTRDDGIPGFDGFDRDQYSAAYLFEQHLGAEWTLSSRARYTGMENDYQIAWAAGLQDDQRTVNRFWFSGVPKLDILTMDNNVGVDFSTGPASHTVLVGLDYQRHVLDERFDMGPASSLDIFDPDYGDGSRGDSFFTSDHRREQTQLGVYVQDELQLDRWTFVLSGRHDWTSSEDRDRTAGSTTEQESEAFSGRVGLLYESEAGLAPYASYSEAFLPVLGSTASGEPFEPERGQQVEAGLKYQPQGATGYLTVAAFDLRRQNVLTPDPDNGNFQVQTGEIRSRGIELEGVASLYAGLDATATYTYLDVEVTESNAGDVGNRPIGVPSSTASFWLDYTVQEGGMAGLGGGGGVRYAGSSYGDAANTLEVDGRTLVDATLHYDWDPFRARLNVSNLFDEVYVASCFTAGSCFYGTARTVRVTLDYRW